MTKLRLKGIIPATVLPQKLNGEIDWDSFEKYIEWLLSQGVHGLAVNVDTGEGLHLYREEKREILKFVVRKVSERVPIIAGTEANFTAQAEEVACDAQFTGADGLLIFPHSSFRGEKQEDIAVNYHQAIARKVKLPMVLFQLQGDLGGVIYSEETLKRLTEIKNVVAIKEASFDALQFTQTISVLRTFPKRITVLTGNDNFILESFLLGAEGALIGFGTVLVKEQVQMFNAIQGKDYSKAFKIYDKIKPVVQVIFASPIRNYRVRLKEILVHLGIIKTSRMRPPLLPLSDEERQKVIRVFEEGYNTSRSH